MKKLQFKTNINCSGCIDKVTPGPAASEIIQAVKKAGFKIEILAN